VHFKLIIALVEDCKTEAVINAAREAGATLLLLVTPVVKVLKRAKLSLA